jgi:SlyX protein
MNEEALNARIEKLEERAAFQENAIEELSDAITEQWKLIDAMKRDTQHLTDELKQVEDNSGRGEPREPPPPHY